MTDSEMRELDAWIAEHVFGYRWFAFEGGKGNRFCDLQIPSTFQERHGGIQCDAPLVGYERDIGGVPRYSKEARPAMEVLEKCAQKCDESGDSVDVSFTKQSPLKWDVGRLQLAVEWSIELSSSAETLPLAICLFAKKLFA